ncbi:multi-sensor hybrid histidine kinase [Halothece sp. PCC 7418]|uniref:ATP-binding protein n=1 Tax=Halothece sp. (strain PCC 7418) TaxID=65093 RepID=UPI0002A07E99|nr:ATP-binding protein [Halothece sp. PCC 7418]AFZ43900.1 multi-sensor hybrid histidine kinase [Halothece sp. PCC 7418]
MKKFPFLRPQISLRWLLLSLCLLQTVGAMGLVGYLSYRSGEKTVEDLANQLLKENSKHVIQDTNYYLRFIYQINQTDLPLDQSHDNSLDELDPIHRYFVHQQQNFPTITMMTFVRPNGEMLVTHRISETQLEAGRSDHNHPQTVEIHAIQEDGTLGKQLRTIHNFDIREKDWYRQAVETGKNGWSTPFPMTVHHNLLGINTYTPLYGTAGNLQGVFAVGFSLERLNQFLAERAIGEQGQVFIIQRDGLLIANSTTDPLSYTPEPPLLRSQPKTELERISGTDKTDPILNKSTQQLKAQLGSLTNIQSLQTLSVEIDNIHHYLQVIPFENPYSFDWLVVSVVPQSEFIGTLQANRNRTLVIGGAIILTVTTLTLIVAHRITRALRRLTEGSEVIAGGNWQQSIAETCRIRELNSLARSYNRMGTEIQQSYDHLNATLNQLKASHQRLEQFLEAIPVGIGIIDAKGQPCYTNQRAVAFLGKGTVPVDRIADIPEVYQLYIAETDQLYPYEQLAVVRALKGESASNHDVEIHLRDRVVPIETWGTPIYNPEGEIEYALVAFQDITERKLSERQLLELSERLELSLAAGRIGSWEWDLTADQVIWDERMYEIYAVAPSIDPKTIPEIWFSRIHPQQRDRVKQLCQEAISEQTSLDTEFSIVLPDHSIRFIKSYGLIRRDAQGNSQAMIGVNFDITELKNAQMELEKVNAELVQANRLKDEFLATMNHELRTPLNAILGMTEALEKETLGAMNPRQHKTLQVIQRSGSHLLEIVNDILDLSKIESGKQELHYSDTSVLELCQSAIALIQPQADQKQLQLQTQFPFPLLKIWVEERLLRQVLINLLSNAVKFTPQGGKITLEVLFPVPQGENWLTFAVRDTGIGIAETNLPKIFQPFVQIDSALNRKYQGTGIGLSLVKRIIELHGGKVRVTSQEGIGTCFYLDLPCVMLPQNALSQSLSSNAAREKTSLILVLEQDEAELMTINDYLEAKGYRLLLAQTEEQAIALATSHSPHLVLVTWQQSTPPPLKLIQTIRNQGHLEMTPLIAIAPEPLSDYHSDLGTEGIKYLSQPIKLKALAQAIQEVMEWGRRSRNHRI